MARFKKRREPSWITADDLLAIYGTRPELFWEHVRQLEHAPNLIRNIVRKKGGWKIGDFCLKKLFFDCIFSVKQQDTINQEYMLLILK
ncbi:MAG: hypothetical protein ABW201_19415 [Candidatus Thiodiazotropha sp.]